jgi:CBS domain-containing protein
LITPADLGGDMNKKKVKDLVISLSEYPHMQYSGTLREAIAKLNEAYKTGHHTVLVFDEDKLVGMLSEKDILKGLDPKFASHYEEGVPMFWDSLLESKSGNEERLAMPVKEILLADMAKADFEGVVYPSILNIWAHEKAGLTFRTVTIDAEGSILKAAHIMLHEHVYILPVVEGGKLIGVVRMGDLFHEISQFVLSQ